MALIGRVDNRKLIDATYEFLAKEEGVITRVYSDSKGIPTLGDGYALVTYNDTTKEWQIRPNLATDLNSIDVVLTQNDIYRLNDTIDILNNDALTQTDKKNKIDSIARRLGCQK